MERRNSHPFHLLRFTFFGKASLLREKVEENAEKYQSIKKQAHFLFSQTLLSTVLYIYSIGFLEYLQTISRSLPRSEERV